MMESLANALTEEREKIQQLRADKLRDVPIDYVERAMARLESAALPFTDWLTEGEAKLRSNRSLEWLRGQFPMWEAQGLARWNPKSARARQYLRAVVPQRANVEAAREAGLRGERVG